MTKRQAYCAQRSNPISEMKDQSQLQGLGQRLRDLRKRKRETQTEVAAFVGVSERTYRNFEYDKAQMTLGIAISLAERYDVSVDWLARGDDSFRQ